MRLHVFLVGVAVWQGSVAAAVPVADALWEKGDYRGAFAQAIEPAIGGDARAQFLIGEAYRLGRSVEPNVPQAEDWYARAARQGDVAAAAELGLLLASDRDPAAALPWLTIAAQHGDPRALCSLAALYFNGDGVARNEALSYALMVRAARTDLPEAKTRLATLRSLLSDDAQNRGEALLASAIPSIALPPAAAQPPAVSPRKAVARTAVAQAAVAPAPAARGMVAPVRIQVGAYRSADAAEKAWSAMRAKVGGLAHVAHAVVKVDDVYRLQAHLRDRPAADDFSRRLEGAGVEHFKRSGTVPA